MQTEIEKRIQKGMNISRDKYGDGGYPEDFDEGFKAGAKFILEMPELREAFKTLERLSKSGDGTHGSKKSSFYDCLPTIQIEFDERKYLALETLSKLKALGIVKESGVV